MQAGDVAVQYLRMSTEHQRYSMENQAAVIAAYALDHGLEIGRTYSDAGKSGLTLKGRPGLQRLLADALSPERDFSAILVLDVSRWGRFQDTDQAAHYEFICREAGVSVAYCAEPFENDGGMMSTIVKHMKRVMAGEYSRELSTKISRAKMRQARLGRRQGGAVPYGFRRQLLHSDGSLGLVLEAGQWKALQGDAVLTIPGPAAELAVVRRIFHSHVEDRYGAQLIARLLNADGIPAVYGRQWTGQLIRNMIRNELYAGTYVYNRTSQTLRTKRRVVPKSEWVRAPAMKPVISVEMFAEAQRIADLGRHARYSDKQLLDALRALLKQEGRLTATMVERSKAVPCRDTYIARFGSFKRAFHLIGYERPRGRFCKVRGAYWTAKEMLAGVVRLRAKHGYVTARLIRADPELPTVGTFARRFGNLQNCYALAGFAQTRGEAVTAGIRRREEKAKSKVARAPSMAV